MEPYFDASRAEQRLYRNWEEAGVFLAGAGADHEAESFCILIPPPNVTGALHIGHAFNNTIQDILIRWHRMRGYNTLWQPGQDHAGIATQMVVERELERRQEPARQELGREAFLERVWQWKEQSGGEIVNQLKRLGASCDWSRDRFTMDKGFHDAVLKVFINLYEQGYIYRGKRLVNWDPHFETAISDLEVEQLEDKGRMWRFRYPLENGETYQHPVEYDRDGQPTAYETRDYLVVATTRPETMLGDTGVAVHPDDTRYSHLVSRTVRLPLAGRSIRIVADSYADPAKGTGAVKITPAHDFNDWEVGQRCGLSAINVMTAKASMRLRDNAAFLEGCDTEPEVLELDGLDRYEARRRIVELARQQGWLDGVSEERHVVPHGDRSKVAVEPYLTDQWYVDAEQIVQPAIDAVRDGRTRIYPAQYESIYFNWLENIEPWCISRQLWWGHQIPVWYDDEGNRYCAASEEEAAKLAGGRNLRRDPDVLDTWFSSGLWPIGTLGWPEATPELERYFPTSVLVTGFDIIFFWVARMMMMQLAVVKDIPFHSIYVHALVRDEHGKKMSKSLGNVIDPIELIDKYGADAVRFTLTSMAALGRDLKLSESRVAGYRNFVTKLWNAARFAEFHNCESQPDFEPDSVSHGLNRWIVGETARARDSVDTALASYRFNDAANGLYAYFWHKVCDWYLELGKPLLADNLEIAAETRATVAWVIEQSLIILHPFMPFVTEELWGLRKGGSDMLALTRWPQYGGAKLQDPGADADVEWIISLIEEIRSVRSELRVPAGARIPLHVLELEEGRASVVADYREMITRLARLSCIEEVKVAGRGSTPFSVAESLFSLPLADIMDLKGELDRLENKKHRLAREISKLDTRLGNQAFLSRAPQRVVEETRQRRDKLRAELAVVEQAINRFRTLIDE